MRDNEIIERVDAFCDAVPRRRARAEEYGPLVIFVPTGSGWPYYARPRRGSRPPVTAADIRAAAQTGAEATKGMIAAKGRTSRLGERALGEIDPGAASAVLVIDALTRHWESL